MIHKLKKFVFHKLLIDLEINKIKKIKLDMLQLHIY